MDKNVLVEYADMKEEIKDLRRRIEKDRRELERLNKVVVTDSVTCGKKGKKPLGTVTIRGVSVGSIQRKNAALEKNIALLEESEISLLKKQTQVEEYIQQIEKSELRIMFRLYYIDNLPWYKVAMHMNQIFPKRRIKYTEDNCRIRHNRFLEKVL
ncbi:hypothetical protein AALA13_05275 [Lachnospiraceae bacterium 50-23]